MKKMIQNVNSDHTAHRFKSLFLVLLSAVALSATFAPKAEAIIISVDGTDYEISTVTGSIAANIPLIQSQPWYGSSSKTETAASDVLLSLGLQNGIIGPYFIYEVNDSLFRASYYASNLTPPSVISASHRHSGAQEGDRTWAVATRVPDAASTLALFGLSLLGLASLRRKLAREIGTG